MTATARRNLEETALALVRSRDKAVHIERVQEELRDLGFDRVDYWGLYSLFERSGFDIEVALYNTGHLVNDPWNYAGSRADRLDETVADNLDWDDPVEVAVDITLVELLNEPRDRPTRAQRDRAEVEASLERWYGP